MRIGGFIHHVAAVQAASQSFAALRPFAIGMDEPEVEAAARHAIRTFELLPLAHHRPRRLYRPLPSPLHLHRLLRVRRAQLLRPHLSPSLPLLWRKAVPRRARQTALRCCVVRAPSPPSRSRTLNALGKPVPERVFARLAHLWEERHRLDPPQANVATIIDDEASLLDVVDTLEGTTSPSSDAAPPPPEPPLPPLFAGSLAIAADALLPPSPFPPRPFYSDFAVGSSTLGPLSS